VTPKLRLFMKISAGLLVALVLFPNAWLWSAGVGRSYTSLEQVPAGSVLVLLGTNEFVGQTEIPTGTYRPRIAAAAALARSGRVKVAIVSGIEAQTFAMARDLRAAGVTCPIVRDPYGWRTLDSVHRVAASYPGEPVVFVSQGWHCDRALWMADRLQLDACAYPAAFGDGWRPLWGAARDLLAKPKAVWDWLTGSELSTAQPVATGNEPVR
jgi:SanA protein